MSEVSKQDSAEQGGKIVAGAAGAGGGTLLVLLADNLPETSPWKSWLVILAPSLSVFLGGVLFWAKASTLQYLKRRALKNALSTAKNTLQEALENKSTSDAHKKELTKKLERLERIAVETHLREVEEIAGTA